MMKKRPLAVTILSCLLIVAGAVGLVYHLRDFSPSKPLQIELVWISLLRVLAIVSGAFMLVGQNWARWLALVWIAFHVAISFYHSIGQVAAHGVMLAVFAYFLFRPEAREYFGGGEMRGNETSGGSV